MANPTYDFSDFFSNGAYNNITWDNGTTNTSIPYANSFTLQASTYYGPKYTGTTNTDLEQNYAPYTQFTDYVVNGIKNKDANVYKYLQWLIEKTSKDGVESGAENLRISPFMSKLWDSAKGTFKEGIDWGSADVKAAVESIANNYSTRRKDGKFGWYHLGPKDPAAIQKAPEAPAQEITVPGSTTYKGQEQPFEPLSSEYPGWSDWIPLTMRKIIDDFTALKNYQLGVQKQYPRVEAPYKHQVVTDAYGQRTALEQQKQDLLRRADNMNGADADANLVQHLSAEEVAQKYDQAQLEQKENEYNQTKKEAESVLDWNRVKGVETANINNQYATAARNSIINERTARNNTLKTNADTYIGDMYSNFGQWLKTKRINKNALIANNAELKKAYDESAASNKYKEKSNNIQYWPQYTSYIQTLLNSDASDAAIGEFRDKVISGELQPGTKDFNDAAKTILVTSSDPSISKYKTSYASFTSTLEDELMKDYTKADIGAKQETYRLNPFVSNQWGFYGTLAKGGKVDRLMQFAKLYEKEQDSVRKNARNRVNKDAEYLNKALDRLSKEQIILLKSVFK